MVCAPLYTKITCPDVFGGHYICSYLREYYEAKANTATLIRGKNGKSLSQMKA